MKTATDVLLGAIKHIENVGWCQGSYERHDGYTCLVGALHVSARGGTQAEVGPEIPASSQPAFSKAILGVVDALHRRNIYASVECWNDMGNRTQEEVIDLLRWAIDQT